MVKVLGKQETHAPQPGMVRCAYKLSSRGMEAEAGSLELAGQSSGLASFLST